MFNSNNNLTLIKKTKSVINTIILLISITLSANLTSATNFYLDDIKSYYFTIPILFLFQIYLIIILIDKSEKETLLNKIDITIFILTLLSILSFITRENRSTSNEHLIAIIIGVYIYICGKNTYNLHSIAVIALAIVYSLQWFTIFPQINQEQSRYNFTDIKGTLGNSNILCIYMASINIFFYYIIKNTLKVNKNFIHLLHIANFTLAAGIIAITQSRGSLVAISICIIYLIYTSKIFINLDINKKIILLPIVTIITISIIVTIYFKYNSTIGRLLILIICSRHVLDHPILGYGTGTFPSLYSSWQESFFKKNSSTADNYKYVADINFSAFNEFIQIIIEQGIPYFLIYSSMIYHILNTKKTNDSKIIIFKTLIISITTFSLFSYPLHSFSILLPFFLLIGLISRSEKRNVLKISHKIIFIFFLFTINSLIITELYKKFISVNNWKNNKFISNNNTKETLLHYNKLYKELSWCEPFMFEYGEILANNNLNFKSIIILTKANNIIEREATYIYLVKQYEAIGKTQKSEEKLIKLNNILPGRIQPKYLLAKLYIVKKDTVNALKFAKLAVNTPIKIQTGDAYRYKREMTDLITRLESLNK